MTDVALKPAVMEGMPEFIEMVCRGIGPLNAALAVGWTPRELRQLESNPDFVEIMDQCKTRRIESVEEIAYDLALNKNVPMIQMILYCHGSDRGWRPPTQRVAVNHQGTVAIERVNAVREAALEIMRQHGPEMLALGSPLDAIETSATDG